MGYREVRERLRRLASPAVAFADEQEFTSASACAAGRPPGRLDDQDECECDSCHDQPRQRLPYGVQRRRRPLGTDGRKPGLIRSGLAGLGGRLGGCYSSRAGAVRSERSATDFGGQCLEFGEPTGGNRGRRAGLGWARSAKVLRIHLAFALYAIESPQREVIKMVK
jgi:hypothetical protein